jgi:hypothetical protein
MRSNNYLKLLKCEQKIAYYFKSILRYPIAITSYYWYHCIYSYNNIDRQYDEKISLVIQYLQLV